MTKLSPLEARLDERTSSILTVLSDIKDHLKELNSQTEKNTKGRVANTNSINWIIRMGGPALILLGGLYGISL